MVTRVLIALAVLATALLLWGWGSPKAAISSNPSLWERSGWQQLAAHHQPQEEKEQGKGFKGTISKNNGNFVLEESSDGGTYGTYLLDDQAAARKYEGQKVVVTGTLDAPHNTIHVRKIEAIA